MKRIGAVLSGIALLFLVWSGPVEMQSLPFEDCGSGVDLKTISISSCRVAPCTIPINQPVTVTAKFGNYNSPSTRVLHHEAFWVLNSINTRAAVTPDICQGVNCPYVGPDGLAFSVNLQAPPGFPALRGTLYWRVYASDNKMLMCFRVPIALIRP